METKFYSFNQNNSGGYFDVDDNVTHMVIIEANSEKQAGALFAAMIENQSGSCPCCGDRWYWEPELIEIEYYAEEGYPVSVYTHYRNYKQRYDNLYGSFNHIEAPSVKKMEHATEYSGSISFNNIEDYAQLMANAYPWCTPDVIIHYLDGTKKQIFSVNPD